MTKWLRVVSIDKVEHMAKEVADYLRFIATRNLLSFVLLIFDGSVYIDPFDV